MLVFEPRGIVYLNETRCVFRVEVDPMVELGGAGGWRS